MAAKRRASDFSEEGIEGEGRPDAHSPPGLGVPLVAAAKCGLRARRV